MPIQPKKQKETSNVHKEIGEVEERFKQKQKEMAEKKEGRRHEKELIKESVKEKTEKPESSKVTPSAKSATVSQRATKKAKQLKNQQKEKQVKLLTDLAFEKGVTHATQVASKLDDPHTLDEFHDTLVDELYKYLVEQDKLKQL